MTQTLTLFVIESIRDFLSKKEFKKILFTDGSKGSEDAILNSKKINPFSSVYTAEALAILEAVKELVSLDINQNYAILSDSLSVLSKLASLSLKKKDVIKEILNLVEDNIYILCKEGF